MAEQLDVWNTLWQWIDYASKCRLFIGMYIVKNVW
ncbi:hypothetical protein DesyoDRAFT_2279 [Desulfosporosinus youngiae DSM 17734]|uniref:Uncharacterized protein n=1 Tax=Desulfosporosinus youngiae DSM 17734 TaxID=768710 RepID=H5XUC6_9FIRM|nr:hypothetical protein DesyoDRAFT_2279 [Desulfosporosinus youngiae DSM 17734]